MDLAFVGGEGERTKHLSCVLLVPLPIATFGPISSGRKLDYRLSFSRTERETLGTKVSNGIRNVSRAVCGIGPNSYLAPDIVSYAPEILRRL